MTKTVYVCQWFFSEIGSFALKALLKAPHVLNVLKDTASHMVGKLLTSMAMTMLSDCVTYQYLNNQSTWNLDQNAISVLIVEVNQPQHKDARWHELRSPNTKPYERWLLKFLVNSTIVDVAKKLDTSEERVTGILDRGVTTKVDWSNFERLEILGIDEIALKKGHRDYVVLVTTPLMEQGVEVLGIYRKIIIQPSPSISL